LTGVRLALQLFADELPPSADTAALEVALRQLTLVETNLKRFLDLGREGTRREPCDLGRLTGEAVELLRPQCRHTSTDLRWIPPASPVVVLGDPGQIGQLVLNLLGNAVEAACPNGRVEVRVRDKKDAARADGGADPRRADERVLEVCDSGPGPPTEIADRLFEPFITGKPEGVGLGLAVARQIAEAHGGYITWDRASGVTCFRVALRCQPEAEAASAAEEKHLS
jgi:signal transduction histidine kinase